MKPLHTPRLSLEPLLESHAPALYEGLRNEALYDFIGDRPPESVEVLGERFRRLETRTSPDGSEAWLNWALRALPAPDYGGWIQATVHSDQSAHIAYIVFHEAWGRGYGREAAAALIDHLRDEWNVECVHATVDTRNQRSIALLEALAFVRGAVRRDAERIRGMSSDEVAYFRIIR